MKRRANRTKQREDEKSVFEDFKNLVFPEKITYFEQRDPPEPDILATFLDGRKQFYELSEVIDKEVSRDLSNGKKLNQYFKEAYDSLPDAIRIAFQEQFGNAIVYIELAETVNLRKIEINLKYFFQELLDLFNPISDTFVFRDTVLKSIFKSVLVNRCDIKGPYFDAFQCVRFDDPTKDCIEKKFGKVYSCLHPIDLILYFQMQKIYPDDLWKRNVNEIIMSTANRPNFERLWFLNIRNQSIVYRHDFFREKKM